MVICMKTTIELPDKILLAAKRFGVARKLTLREVILTALHQLLEQPARTQQFQLPDCSVDGTGLNPEFDGAGWTVIRDAAYGMEGK
jgi:hypothetical protein